MNRVIATLAGAPESMVLDGASLVLIDDVFPLTSVVRVDIASGAATTLYGGTQAQRVGYGLVADADRFYVYSYDASHTGSIVALPRAGGAPVTIVGLGTAPIGQIAVNATHVYWGDLSASPSIVMQTPLSGGPGVPVTGTDGAESFAVDDEAIYWSSVSASSNVPPQTLRQISSTPLAGGPVTVLAKGLVNPSTFVVSGGSVYWIDLGQTNAHCAFGPSELVTVPSAGGTVKVLAGNLFGTSSFAVSGDTAYLIAADGGCPGTMTPLPVSKVVAGAQPEKLGTSNIAGPIVIDGTKVYVADTDSAGTTILIREMN
jgi:hypothetical protein